MAEITTVGLDLAKNVFQAHGAEVWARLASRAAPPTATTAVIETAL